MNNQNLKEIVLNRAYSLESMKKEHYDLRAVTDLYYGKTVIKKLQEAVEGEGDITIYGDYDADGVMAVYILYSALSRITGNRINWFVNNRFDDGYNITEESMKKCLSKYPDTKTLITCDNGINAAEAVDYAMKQGVSVLVTDHHIQTKPLRGDCPAIDERAIKQMEKDAAAGTEPEAFCGAELARRVIEAVYERMGLSDAHKDFLEGLYAYSGLATVTDHVPMNPHNHHVARKGLQIIQKEAGFWGFLKEEFIGGKKKIHWDTIGFYYGPLLNASGRMTGEATHAINMPLSYDSGDEEACRASIRELVALNLERRELSAHDDAVASRIIFKDSLSSSPFILVWSDDFSEGINGLTATHITERYRVPAAVLSPTKNDPDVYKGSARSVEGANLIDLLKAHDDLVQAGGHAMAAGLSIRKENLETVRKLLCEDLAHFQAPPEDAPDYSYNAKDLTLEDIAFQERIIEEYEPFGPGFEEPRLEFKGIAKKIWRKKKKDSEELVHASFPMEQSADGKSVEAIWWNHLPDAEAWYQDQEGKPLHCSGKLELNRYVPRGGAERITIQIIIDKILNV